VRPRLAFASVRIRGVAKLSQIELNRANAAAGLRGLSLDDLIGQVNMGVKLLSG
jgi:hypothetical protein